MIDATHLLAADHPWPPAIATMAVGLLAFLGAVAGLAQKWRNDRRERWWDRVQWALGRLDGDEDTRTLALVVLAELVGSKLATNEDAAMLQEVGQYILNQ